MKGTAGCPEQSRRAQSYTGYNSLQLSHMIRQKKKERKEEEGRKLNLLHA